MSHAFPEYRPGQRVAHADLGEGVIVAYEPSGFLRVYFLAVGERQVAPQTVRPALSWNERVVQGLRTATPDRLEQVWLALEAAELPLLDGAATLTSAKIDMLPHQVVLIHRLANTRPRRFLIADEVGLGKTIETALILRELASRGELQRALMIVPAGLVENWRAELNDVFNLDFEVFGHDGDVTDRKSNAFAKHDRLIASVDTLKQPTRRKRLLEAPPWDLLVFDEAHHLSVYKSGNKSRKTENFKLAETLREHSRDLIFLSATPHQGDHFRFWMLIRLLAPELFQDETDMIANRHRLNAVVIRRTKADACAADGSPLFARRVVHTAGFTLSMAERAFYDALLEYLRDGYNLAAKQGRQGQALGFVMTIFQKIAASSFAAVRSTLLRRLLMLTIQEAIERDEMLDVDGRDHALIEARALISEMYTLGDDPVSRAQGDQLLVEAKIQLLKRRKDVDAHVLSAESLNDAEIASSIGEEAAVSLVTVALPQERQRIRGLLSVFPSGMETKTQELLNALAQLWQINADEKVVIFATYLASVDSLKTAVEKAFPQKGVEVLKGGDHGAKTAAQRRFKRSDGPRVLISTAAGREGINLQFARVLFNYDLPWNPMDLEQRIGRIHRYGQIHAAQVYNLVAIDTIEGEIYLLLEEKLIDIAKTLGKVDEKGEVTEDLRGQILGQLSSRLSYDRLYQEAVLDPSLRRTRQELEVAVANASLARRVVFELFQDLDKFNLADYIRYDDEGRSMARLLTFARRVAKAEGGELRPLSDDLFELIRPQQARLLFTTERQKALDRDDLHLLGLEHPIVSAWLERYSTLVPEDRAIAARFDGEEADRGLFTIWQVVIHSPDGQIQQHIVRLGLTFDGERSVAVERHARDLLLLQAGDTSDLDLVLLASIIEHTAPQLLHRQLAYAGALPEGASYSSKLIGCVILV